MASNSKADLPAEGTAFAFPIGDGRFSVCRVVLDVTSSQSKQWGNDVLLVACSEWIGDVVPNADDPALRPILHLTHHSWDGQPEVQWVSEPPPDDFIPIGRIVPTKKEKAIQNASFGSWYSVRIQPLIQWRWDNDRAALLAEETIEEEAEAQERDREKLARHEYLENVTLEQLRNHQFFPRWKDYPPSEAIEASRKIMTDTVERLYRLGPDTSEEDRISVLRECIESFNRIDDAMDNFIETVEREDICEEFEAIVHACGLGTHEDLADEWRDW